MMKQRAYRYPLEVNFNVFVVLLQFSCCYLCFVLCVVCCNKQVTKLYMKCSHLYVKNNCIRQVEFELYCGWAVVVTTCYFLIYPTAKVKMCEKCEGVNCVGWCTNPAVLWLFVINYPPCQHHNTTLGNNQHYITLLHNTHNSTLLQNTHNLTLLHNTLILHFYT